MTAPFVYLQTDNDFLCFTLDKIATSVGPTSGQFDIVINGSPSEGILFLKETVGSVKITKLSPKSKRDSGPWEKSVSQISLLETPGLKIVLLPKGVPANESASTPDKWNLDLLPTDPASADFSEKMLSFLLQVVGAPQGGVLLCRQGPVVTTLATVGLKFRIKDEVFVRQYFDLPQDVVVIDAGTHSTHFVDQSMPVNFMLVKSASKHGQIGVYIPMPGTTSISTGMLQTLLRLALQSIELHLVTTLWRQKVSLAPDQHGIIWGSDPGLARVKQLADKVAKIDMNVIITGETGTGKEEVARYIAAQSGKPKWVAVNCAAIPQELAESLLFGHSKGSFTGAHRDQIGKLAEAHGGILFLDEIGELSAAVQAKLLRVLQTGKCQPIGGREVTTSFKLICATHRPLEKMVRDGQFREDLWYRLNEIQIHLPPLRERLGSDLIGMAKFFLQKTIEQNQLLSLSLSPEVTDWLTTYPWPGNVRQLRSIIRRAAVLADGPVVELQDLKAGGAPLTESAAESTTTDPTTSWDLKLAKDQFTFRHVSRALAKCHGNRQQAAELLGIAPRSLFRLLAEWQDTATVGRDHDNSVRDTHATN